MELSSDLISRLVRYYHTGDVGIVIDVTPTVVRVWSHSYPNYIIECWHIWFNSLFDLVC